MDYNSIALGVILSVLFVFSFFFSLCEAAFISVHEDKIFKVKKDGVRSAGVVLSLLKDREKVISLILLCINIIHIVASSISALLFARLFESHGGLGFLLSTVFMTTMIFVFGEAIPKTIGIRQSVSITLYWSRLILLLLKLFFPIAYVIGLINGYLKSKFKDDWDNQDAGESILGVVEMYHQKGTLENHEKQMLNGVLSLDNIDVKDVMIHRNQMVAIDICDDIETILTKVRACKFSRIPFYQENDDNMLGVLDIKDLFIAIGSCDKPITNDDIKSLLKEPRFIPGEASLVSQLNIFRNNGNTLAFVVDEYGGIMGIITIQDIMEEIIGDIGGDNTTKKDNIQMINESTFIISADTGLKEVNNEIKTNFKDSEVSSIGGFLINRIEKIPEANEEFEIDNCIIKIISTTANRILSVQITKLSHDENDIEEV